MNLGLAFFTIGHIIEEYKINLNVSDTATSSEKYLKLLPNQFRAAGSQAIYIAVYNIYHKDLSML